ncbi:cilia- and flagella-associated protein 91-like [Leptopilina heterotoma]|uniref:cilia- and flagella-associated protein 91-like n=1 Tax=Leptopilina heterotoma TaxID=63436 RepID=UPI001CA9F6B3|nr:cilia- and flagella-associated protein 91-like [Leptopilina heterotoma]
MANAVQCVQLQKSELYRINPGVDVQKFYRRPLVPFISPEVPKLRLLSNLSQENENETIQNSEKFSHALPSRLEYVQDRGTQTDYRESECQTSPWEPPYKILPGHNPEVLNLSHLTWKNGLPVGMHEIENINRMRKRRAWEKILPPMDSESNVKLRTKIVAALEADEWAFRESEIEFIMKIRMDLAEKAMRSRNDKWNKKKKDRFSRLGSNLEEKRDKEISKIRQKFGREIRKLTIKHRDRIGSRNQEFIIRQHEDRVNELFPTRQIPFGIKSRRRREVIKKFPQHGEIMEMKEISFPTIEEFFSIKLKRKEGELCVRETKWNDAKLEELYRELKRVRLNVQPTDTIDTREQKPKVLPPTPGVTGDDTSLNIKNESATLIQKTIRGRAIQYMMFEGREKCKDLIKELQMAYAIQDEDNIQENEPDIINLSQEENLTSYQESRLREILSPLEGMQISGMMDFLGKELTKLEDERKIHAFALLAEREKIKGEASDSGQREDEIQRRKELDQLFRQIGKVNQDTVDAFLEDIVKEAIDWISEKEAKEYVLALADKIDSVSKYAAENAAEIDEEEMVSDMVHNFILPEVEREIMKKKIRVKQQEYLNNAHSSIYDELLNLSLSEESEHQKEIETLDINLPTTSTRLSFSESKTNTIHEDYRIIIDTIIDKIMSYVIPNENEFTIREILNDVIVEIVEDIQEKLINETSFSSSSSFTDD